MSYLPPANRAYRDSIAPLPLNDVLARFPTLAATSPHASRSEKYTFISTRGILEKLTNEGFTIHGVMTARTRAPKPGAVSRLGYEKHAVTLRRSDLTFNDIGDVLPQITLVGSHDGSSSLEFFAGMFRLVCLNGLKIGTAWASYKVKHIGDITAPVLDATYSVVSQFGEVADKVQEFKSVTLSDDAQHAFASEALALRYDDSTAPVTPLALLGARRSEDTASDLWTVFNRVQENLIRGGIRGRVMGDNGRMRNTSIRAINGVNSDLKINRGLFDLAEKYAAIAA